MNLEYQKLIQKCKITLCNLKNAINLNILINLLVIMKKYSKTLYLPDDWNNIKVANTVEILISLFSDKNIQSIVFKTYSEKFGKDKMNRDLEDVNILIDAMKPKPMGRPKNENV